MRPRSITIVAITAAVTVVTHSALRLMGRTWGATSEEAHRALPGDEHVPDIDSQITMAITIEAPPDAVWPWLVQMGIDRAGFYTHTWLENGLMRLGVTNADRIHPEWQTLAVGDHLWFVPEGYPVPQNGPRVAALEPNCHLVCTLGFGPGPAVGTWQYVLEAQGQETRLLFRSRASSTRTLGTRVFDAIAEPGYIYMEIGMMRGIKARIEREAAAISNADKDERVPTHLGVRQHPAA